MLVDAWNISTVGFANVICTCYVVQTQTNRIFIFLPRISRSTILTAKEPWKRSQCIFKYYGYTLNLVAVGRSKKYRWSTDICHLQTTGWRFVSLGFLGNCVPQTKKLPRDKLERVTIMVDPLLWALSILDINKHL